LRELLREGSAHVRAGIPTRPERVGQKVANSDELHWTQVGHVEVAWLVVAGQEAEVSKVLEGGKWYALVGIPDPSFRMAPSVDPDEKTAVLNAIAKAEEVLTKK
jgi:hypothetical protein